MRFKKILEEERSVKELNQLLKKEFKNNKKTLLYRQTDRGINDWTVRKIRSDRNPIGASYVTQVLLDFIAKKRSDKIPLRHSSKFAMTVKGSKSFGSYDFGDYQYIVFPDKNADIVSFDKDTKRIREKIDWGFTLVSRDELDSNLLKDFVKRVDRFSNEKISNRTFKKYLKMKWKNIKKELKRSNNEDVKKIWSGICKYFEEMRRGIKNNHEEILFDGDRYLYVEPDLFKENFVWTGNKWEMNNET